MKPRADASSRPDSRNFERFIANLQCSVRCCGERQAPAGPGGPQHGHVDTTRNRAAPKVELALIAIDFMGRGG
ncbi:hypothetical protein DM992_01740 [Burkholderia sp. JP2-270]|nr:hypothetical protein DM992_01740 [Burkholderia sp. JP2-270]